MLILSGYFFLKLIVKSVGIFYRFSKRFLTVSWLKFTTLFHFLLFI